MQTEGLNTTTQGRVETKGNTATIRADETTEVKLNTKDDQN